MWSSETFSSDLVEHTHLRSKISEHTPSSILCVCVCVFCSVIIPQAKCFFFVVFFAFFFLSSDFASTFGPFVVLHFLTVIKRGDTRRRDIHINIHKEERFERDFLLYSRSARTVSKHTQNLNKSF